MNTDPETIKPPQIIPTAVPVLNLLAKLCESDAKVTQSPERQVETVSKPEIVIPPPNQDQAKKTSVNKPATPI